MTALRALSITASAFAAHYLLLPTLVPWNIGGKIRACAETRVGIHPMVVYAVGQKTLLPEPCTTEDAGDIGSMGDGRICVAREARYVADSPLIALNEQFFPVAVRDISLTPHYRRVEFDHFKLGGLRTTVGERLDPAGLPMEKLEYSTEGIQAELTAAGMGCAEVERGRRYPFAAAAAAPFDYIIDPALAVISAPVAAPGVPLAAAAIEMLARMSTETTPQPTTSAP